MSPRKISLAPAVPSDDSNGEFVARSFNYFLNNSNKCILNLINSSKIARIIGSDDTAIRWLRLWISGHVTPAARNLLVISRM